MRNNSWYLKLGIYLLQAFCQEGYRRFLTSIRHPEAVQDALLRKQVRDLARTEYGHYYGLSGNEDYETFVEKLPLQHYEDLEPWIHRQLKFPKQAILTPHDIIHAEPTSGSSGSIKQIPYTQPLLKTFSRMFQVWACDQLSYGFKPETGRIFMSISPSLGMTDAQVGFTDEREYLDAPLRSLLSPFLVLLPRIAREDFQQVLARTLLQEEGLEIISIWSPSYLLILLDYIQTHREALVEELSPAQREKLLSNPIDWEAIWPKLKFISCWDNALAEPLAGQIRALFPNVQVQGKGLLATEAPVTVPLLGVSGGLPLVNDVFLEFMAADGKIRRLHELSDGAHYQVILTQSAGLTRYCLNDLVEVSGFYRNTKTPCLKFIGRAQQICDLTGEKLHECFVREVLLPLLPSGHFLLVPCQADPMGYVLLTDTVRSGIAEESEAALCQAHHYLQARHCKQLAPLQVFCIPDLLSRLQAFHQREGLRMGNIKDSALVTDPAYGQRLLTYVMGEPDQPVRLPVEVAVQNNRSRPAHPPVSPYRAGASGS